VYEKNKMNKIRQLLWTNQGRPNQ